MNPEIFHLIATYLKKIKYKLYRIKSEAPRRVLGDYIGDKMIGITHIFPFNIMINKVVRKVKIKKRNRQETGWSKVIDTFSEKLFESSFSVHSLECLLEATRDKVALQRINHSIFFLSEIKCPKELMKACICIAKGDFSIGSTVELPSLRNRNAMAAFIKVMTTADLSKFTLSGGGCEVNISVPREKIKDFVNKLDEMRK